jgi:CBS domain-containing protein
MSTPMSIGTTRVDEVMTTTVFTVGPKEKIANLAKMFEKHDVNAAPVVNDDNVCIGIITSHDLVEYESTRIEVETHLGRGPGFDQAHYWDGRSFPLLRVPIDEVGIQMTTNVASTERHAPVSRAAKLMCERHVHHLVVLDEQKHPVGILSSLDILGHLTGEPIARHAQGQTPDSPGTASPA